MVKGILVNRKSDEALKSQLKMEHADLVAEMQTVENLPTHERLQLARLRRTQQLKAARQKEKEWLKIQRAKGAYNGTSGNSSTTHHFRTSNSSRHISFENSVVLLEAASRNDMHEVAELLQHGITPDAANEDGLTALHQCCIDCNVEMLKLLLQYGANVDAQDSDKWTPLHAAATCGHLELVRILIDHGANLLAVNTDGNMPYDLCDDERTLDFIEAEMSKRGVTQELIDETRSSTERQMLRDLTEVVRNGGDLEEPDYQGATPLHIAAANGYVRVVEFLLEMHVNVDALDKDLWTPVHAAACWGHLEVLEMLAQCGADLNVKNKDDETPSDICEDLEIRERIEQLRTEQESKRLAEAQRRRVRRSQSNNTRAQSVRRTSLRDKTLTTKKDAVEEARLRLQAQEVFIPPDSTTSETNGSLLTPTTATSNQNSSALEHATSDTTTHNWLTNGPNQHKNNNNNNNNEQLKSYQQASLALNGSDAVDASLTTNSATTNTTTHSTFIPRRPPDGRENDELQLNAQKRASLIEQQQKQRATGDIVVTSAKAGTTTATDGVQIQSSKEAANGKINVQVTVLVDTASTLHQHHHHAPAKATAAATHVETAFAGATLANLKKQRSLSRTNILNCENGSVLGAATTNTTTTTNTANYNNSIGGGNSGSSSSTNNNNNNNTNGGILIDGLTTTTAISNQPLAGGLLHPSLSLDFNGDSAAYTTTAATSAASSVNKFSGITGDVVSDSTSSKKCCTLM